MKTKIAFLYFRNNAMTGEKICVGLFYIVGNEVSFYLSEKKLKFVKKINKNGHFLFSYYIERMIRSINKMKLKDVAKESVHQNGIVHISTPRTIAMSTIENKELFIKNIFEKHVNNL